MEENLNQNQKPNKQEPGTETKKKKAKVAIITLSTIVVLFLGLQVYASTNGYGNVFFMIKNLITTGNPAGEQEIFSDKDITLSYKSIELAEGLKIQANRLEIKDGKTKLFLSVKSQNGDVLPLKYEVTTISNEGNETTTTTKITGNKPENTDNFDYEDVLTLDYEVQDNKTIVLKIKDSSEKELRTLEINLQTREITVKGEKDFEKISEIELKKYLGAFALLNDKSNYTVSDNLIEIATKIQAIDNSKILLKRETINEIAKQIYGENVKFETKKDSQGKDVEVLKDMRVGTYEKLDDMYDLMEHDRVGKCLKIEDIKFEEDIYTVKYIYVLATSEQVNADKLEDLPQYETTIKLKRDENNLYSKYQVISIEKGNEIKNKISTNVSIDSDNKQSSIGAWYTIDSYQNNDQKIRFTNDDFDKVMGNINVDKTKGYPITGINGKVKKIYQSNNGTSVDPMTFFLLEDGTIQYILPFEQMMNGMPTSFKIDGKIDQVKDAVEIKTNKNDVVIAVLKNGQEVKIWNQFMEDWGNDDTTSSTNTTSNDDFMNTNNWIQYWPDIGMKFKLPNTFKQGKVKEEQGLISVDLSGEIVLPISHPDRTTDPKTENVPVIIRAYTEIHGNNVNVWDVLENNEERSVKSKDNKQWSDWYPLKNDDVADSSPNGYIRRSYGRVRGDMVEKVIFDLKTNYGMDVPHYTFVRNVLETVSSTSR